ncbi:MAG: tetratricopeptide repeat protein [Polyangiales bacterium]
MSPPFHAATSPDLSRLADLVPEGPEVSHSTRTLAYRLLGVELARARFVPALLWSVDDGAIHWAAEVAELSPEGAPRVEPGEPASGTRVPRADVARLLGDGVPVVALPWGASWLYARVTLLVERVSFTESAAAQPAYDRTLVIHGHGAPGEDALSRQMAAHLDGPDPVTPLRELGLSLARGDDARGALRVGKLLGMMGVADASLDVLRATAEASRDAETWVDVAELADRLGHDDEATRAADRAIEDAPAHPAGWSFRAALAWRDGDLEQARARFTEAIRLGERRPRAYESLARVFVAMDRIDDARETLRALADLELGADPEDHLSRAGARLSVGRVDDALDDFDLALLASPELAQEPRLEPTFARAREHPRGAWLLAATRGELG